MKKIYKILISVGAAVIVAVSVLLVILLEGDKNVEYTLNVNGGVVSSTTVKVKEGEEFTLPIPTRNGYQFEGWYVTEDCTGEPVTKVNGKEGLTFYAKWSKLYTVTLELGGGNLSTTSLQLKAGENLYSYMQAYTPTKSGVAFSAWFENGKELSKSKVMPEENITLTAKYKVEYTIQFWVKNLENDEYSLMKDNDENPVVVVGSAYEKEQFVSDISNYAEYLVGFREITHVDERTSGVLSSDKSENIFKHYFDRKEVQLSFHSNYPDGTGSETDPVTLLVGQEQEAPSDYTYDGYVLVGWSVSPNGDTLDYKVNSIANAVYGNTTYVPSDMIAPKITTTLYAVWLKGYTNMFAGSDYVYRLDDNSDVIYIARGGVFFQGVYDKEYGTFYLDTPGDDIYGRLNADGTYSYSSSERNEWFCSLYENGEFNEDVTINLDEYNGLIYTVDGVEYKGTYLLNEDGYYEVTYEKAELEDGEVAEEYKMTIVIGTVNEKQAFQIRNEEEYALGELTRFVVAESGGQTVLTYYPEAYKLTLTGFGIAYYFNGSNTATYYYTREGNTVTLTTSNNKTFGIISLMDEMGMKGYMLYAEELDRTFELENGASLVLDGLHNATYKSTTVNATGSYVTEESAFGQLITFSATDGNTYKFLITSETVEVPDESEDAEPDAVIKQTTYYATQKHSAYAEYYYSQYDAIKGEQTSYYAPYIVFNEPTAGVATIYGFKTDKSGYVKIATAKITQDSKTKLYTLSDITAIPYQDEIFNEPIDFSKVKTAIFALDTEMGSLAIHYWYSWTDTQGNSTYFDKKYESSVTNDNAILTLVGGIAIYDKNGTLDIGLFSTQGDLLAFKTKSGTLYFEINEANETFLKLEHSPYSAYLMNSNGTANNNEYISFDGKGGAEYVIKGKTASEDTKIPGTLTKTDETVDGYYVYTFKATDNSKDIKFIQVTVDNKAYFLAYSDANAGVYTGAGGATLKLDGYCYRASYNDKDGKVYNGGYVISEDRKLVTFIWEEGGYLYFDINATGKTFTVKGREYGSYLLYDNQSWEGYYLDFDGYGNLVVYTAKADQTEESGYKRIPVDNEATYEKIGENSYLIKFKYEGRNMAFTGVLGYVSMGGDQYYQTFIVSREEFVKVYVNESDWSVIILDDIGNATRYDKNGVAERGLYTVITDKLFYFVNAGYTDACIYEYDNEKGKIVAVDNEEVGYYTANLESLLFSRFGYAIFNGEEYCYYDIDDNGNVTIYRQDAMNPNANTYGFVEDKEFGSLTVEKTYQGKNYTKVSHHMLTFKRLESDKENYKAIWDATNNYPLEDLMFTPAGNSSTFSVAAGVTINGQQLTGTISRKIVDNKPVMVLSVASFEFDIELEFKGEDENRMPLSTYKVTGMRYVNEMMSSAAMDLLFMYVYIDMLTGSNFSATFENTIGTITLVTVYNSASGIESYHIDGEFGDGSGMYDLNGKLLSFKNSAYTFDEKTGIYTVEVAGTDGYTYKVHFRAEKHQVFGIPGYVLYACTRVQTLEDQTNGYTINVERIIMSDIASAGDIYSIVLKDKDGVEIKSEIVYENDKKLYYVARETDTVTGKITSTVYYVITLEEDTSIEVEEENKDPLAIKKIPPYKTNVTVLKNETVQTKYTSDDKSYVDIVNGKVMFLSIDGVKYLASTCEYDETTDVYTVTTTAKKVFMVKVVENNVEITEKVATEN